MSLLENTLIYTCIFTNSTHLSLTAAISSRPGQSGRSDGYLLEGKELEFYVKKIKSKKSK